MRVETGQILYVLVCVTVSTNQNALAFGNQVSTSTDSLVAGLSFLLITNILQRAVGFLRNVGLCDLLDETQLGLWALASSFFVLAAPFSVLGLPGTFGRFVESYRRQGQLRIFLRRIVSVSCVGVSITASALLLAPQSFGSLVFGEQQTLATMSLVVSTLLAVITFNALTELFGGLRMPRLVSAMHAINSLTFTIISILGLIWIRDWRILVVAFGLSALIAMMPAWFKLRSLPEMDLSNIESPKIDGMWRRIAPFAMSLWAMNLLSNLFDVVDRYMLLHLSGPTIEAGQSVVGQFHSGLIIPSLISNLAMMIAGMLLPYLASDWEAGRVERVTATMRSCFKIGSLFFVALAIGASIVAPWIFNIVLGGRYSDGLGIMPIALVHCSWMALAMLLQNYSWCLERGRQLGFITGTALIVNVGLNAVLVPRLGIYGAMTATAVSGGIILGINMLMSARHGLKLGHESVLFAVLPLSLLAGPVVATALLGATIILIGRTTWMLSCDEKSAIEAVVAPLFRRLGLPNTRLWPSRAI